MRDLLLVLAPLRDFKHTSRVLKVKTNTFLIVQLVSTWYCSTRREKNIWSIFEIISTMSSKCHKETLKLISESEIPLDGKSKSCFRNQSKYMHKENIWGIIS